MTALREVVLTGLGVVSPISIGRASCGNRSSRDTAKCERRLLSMKTSFPFATAANHQLQRQALFHAVQELEGHVSGNLVGLCRGSIGQQAGRHPRGRR